MAKMPKAPVMKTAADIQAEMEAEAEAKRRKILVSQVLVLPSLPASSMERPITRDGELELIVARM
jgi:hypothetical protein